MLALRMLVCIAYADVISEQNVVIWASINMIQNVTIPYDMRNVHLITDYSLVYVGLTETES